MTDWANNTIEVLNFLVPGFIAAAVYYGLTSAPKPNTFERLIQALNLHHHRPGPHQPRNAVQPVRRREVARGGSDWNHRDRGYPWIWCSSVGQHGPAAPLAPTIAHHKENGLPNGLVRRVRKPPGLLRHPPSTRPPTTLRLAEPVAWPPRRPAVRHRRTTVAHRHRTGLGRRSVCRPSRRRRNGRVSNRPPRTTDRGTRKCACSRTLRRDVRRIVSRIELTSRTIPGPCRIQAKGHHRPHHRPRRQRRIPLGADTASRESPLNPLAYARPRAGMHVRLGRADEPRGGDFLFNLTFEEDAW